MKYIILISIVSISLLASKDFYQKKNVSLGNNESKIKEFIDCLDKDRCNNLDCLNLIESIKLDTIPDKDANRILFEISRCGIYYRDRLSWDTIIYNNDFMILDTLLSKGLDINAMNANNQNVLYLNRKSKRMLWYLLDRGISPFQGGNNNKNLIDIMIKDLFTIYGFRSQSTGEFISRDDKLDSFKIDKVYAISLLFDYGLYPNDFTVDKKLSHVEQKKKLKDYLVNKAFKHDFLDLVDYLAKYGLPEVNPKIIR